jgi:hypothetical protein
MTYSPTSSEFLECAQREFQFLVGEFGFTVSIPPSPGGGFGQFEVIYHSRHLDVSVAGINWGFGVQVILTPFESGSVHPLERVPFWAIAQLRCPDELQQAHQVSGQLAQLQAYACLLHTYGADVLRGDFTILPSANAVVAEEAARSREPKKGYLP